MPRRPEICFTEPKGPDAVTRFLHEVLPLGLQNHFRDRYETTEYIVVQGR
jgi:hypothetical protein